MKSSDDYLDYIDFISDYQNVIMWLFDSAEIQENYKVSSYGQIVKEMMLNAFKELAGSKNKNIRERGFTAFAGDCGPGFELYAIAIPAKTRSKIIEMLTESLSEVKGFQTIEYGNIPAVPLVPVFRYDRGAVVEYVSDRDLAGKYRCDELGINVFYRLWESAEGFDCEEECCDSRVEVIH